MSSQRIRYESHKGQEDVVISIQTFISEKTGARYRIVLFLKEGLYKIRNENTYVFVASNVKPINNLNHLKKMAKNRLMKLGAKFEEELRNRSFGLCEKGYTQNKHSSHPERTEQQTNIQT
jgi:hypothetical protein